MAALARTLYSWVSRIIGSLSVCLGARIVMTVLPASAVLLQYAFCSFSWGNLAIAACVWALQTWIGICFSYHRQLTHKSFKTPKWLVSPWGQMQFEHFLGFIATGVSGLIATGVTLTGE